MADAAEHAAVASEIAGSFSAASRITGPLGLLPGVGTVTGLAGMGADAASVIAEKRAESFRCTSSVPRLLTTSLCATSSRHYATIALRDHVTLPRASVT